MAPLLSLDEFKVVTSSQLGGALWTLCHDQSPSAFTIVTASILISGLSIRTLHEQHIRLCPLALSLIGFLLTCDSVDVVQSTPVINAIGVIEGMIAAMLELAARRINPRWHQYREHAMDALIAISMRDGFEDIPSGTPTADSLVLSLVRFLDRLGICLCPSSESNVKINRLKKLLFHLNPRPALALMALLIRRVPRDLLMQHLSMLEHVIFDDEGVDPTQEIRALASALEAYEPPSGDTLVAYPFSYATPDAGANEIGDDEQMQGQDVDYHRAPDQETQPNRQAGGYLFIRRGLCLFAGTEAQQSIETAAIRVSRDGDLIKFELYERGIIAFINPHGLDEDSLYRELSAALRVSIH